jgi:hypothetical protein
MTTRRYQNDPRPLGDILEEIEKACVHPYIRQAVEDEHAGRTVDWDQVYRRVDQATESNQLDLGMAI